jgi:rRNA maturation endonuclease Nob1
MAEANVRTEIGICLTHEDQHFKTPECENWRSECERKGHVYWNHGTTNEGNKCMDCGDPKKIPLSDEILEATEQELEALGVMLEGAGFGAH